MKEIGRKIHGFGKALMMPILVIADAGIFLGLAAAMQNTAVTGEAFARLHYPQMISGFIRQVQAHCSPTCRWWDSAYRLFSPPSATASPGWSSLSAKAAPSKCGCTVVAIGCWPRLACTIF